MILNKPHVQGVYGDSGDEDEAERMMAPPRGNLPGLGLRDCVEVVLNVTVKKTRRRNTTIIVPQRDLPKLIPM